MSAQQKPRIDEEDDLDDLDDVLDQFSQPAQPAPPASTSPQPVADTNEEALTSEFTAQLAEGMESLFRELGFEPGAGVQGAPEGAPQERFKAAWEAMLVEGMDEMSDPSASTSYARTPADASSPRPKEDNFQSRIRSTVSRLRESESGLQSSDSSASAGGEPLQSLLSQLEGLGDGDGAEGEEQLQEMLEAMMGQLMSKDVLYEPLKELHDKFPEYLTKNASTISPQDKARYEAQISCIKRLIDAFEEPTYRDEDEKAREKIVALMTELQSHGQPPEDVIGPLPPGLSMGADGPPDMPDGCKLN
ncbi:Pex19 protein [Boletus coccyginus]|nr:Pex19 protein [Boletus coccyginus]